MSILTLFLTTRIGHEGGTAPDELWAKRIETPWLPQIGDRFELWDEGPDAEVRLRYWNHDGAVNAYLLDHVIDPDPQMRANMTIGSSWFDRNTAWYSERDGDLHAQLEAGGWARWTRDF